MNMSRRGQKSFPITLVKDATIDKISSNKLRIDRDSFEKKTVSFDKNNSGVEYFNKTIWREFPSLNGKDFSLFRLGCTNGVGRNEKTMLIQLPSDVVSAFALCNCKDLNRSHLYIKERTFSSSPHSSQGNTCTGHDDANSPDKMTVEPAIPSAEIQNSFYHRQTVRVIPMTPDGKECPNPPMYAQTIMEKNKMPIFILQPTPLPNQAQASSQDNLISKGCQQEGIRAVDSSSNVETLSSVYRAGDDCNGGLAAHENSSSVHEDNGPVTDDTTPMEISDDHDANNTSDDENEDNSHSASESEQTSFDCEDPDKFLVAHLDPDSGLLDALVEQQTLTMEQYHNIRLMPSTIEKRCRRLIKYADDNGWLEDDDLISALKKVNQVHIVNYLESDAHHSPDVGEDWPIEQSESWKLITNRRELIRCLDALKLSDFLLQRNVIMERQRDLIMSKRTKSEQNEILLEILMRGNQRQYRIVTRSLRELKQDNVADFLEREPDQNHIPMMETIIQHAAIRGLTILNNELFVATGKSTIEVYGSTTFEFYRIIAVADACLVALDSCARENCLYIVDSNDNSVVRLSLEGCIQKKWNPIDNDKISDLSVAHDSNILLIFEAKHHIHEYSAEGNFHHTIDIHLNSFEHFRVLHALKQDDNEYLVSVSHDLHAKNEIFRVDAKANIQKSFPLDACVYDLHFAVHQRRFSIVADQSKKRILLLGPDLNYQGDILTAEKHKLHKPQKIYFDKLSNYLFVVNFVDPMHELLVYKGLTV